MKNPAKDADAAAAYTAMLKWKEQGNLIDSDLLISILKNPELIKKHRVEHEFSEDALNEPAAMIKEGISPTPDVGPKKSCDVSGSGSLSSPKMVTGTNKPSLQDNVRVAPFSWTPSVSFKMSGSNEMVINNLISKLRGTCQPPRPQIPVSSFQAVPVVVTAGTGPSPRPQFPNTSLHLGPVLNVGTNRPSIVITVGTGPSPRPDTPRPSFLCVPPQNVAMPSPIGTSLRHDISSLHSVPKIVPQGAPFMVSTAPPKDMEYLKSLKRAENPILPILANHFLQNLVPVSV